MEALETVEWTPPEPEETRLVRIALEGKKFTENMRDEQRSAEKWQSSGRRGRRSIS